MARGFVISCLPAYRHLLIRLCLWLFLSCIPSSLPPLYMVTRRSARGSNFVCDNHTTMYILTKGRSKEAVTMKLMRTLTMRAVKNHFVFMVNICLLNVTILQMFSLVYSWIVSGAWPPMPKLFPLHARP